MKNSQTPALIIGGRVIDPKNRRDGFFDILVENGKISKVEKNIKPAPNWNLIPAKGLWLFPGLIDAHVHLREPGGETSETIESGTRAAVNGGVTSLLAMANTQPPIDSPQKVRFILKRAKEKASAKVYPVGAVTLGLEGKRIAPLEKMARAGARAFSDDGRCVMNSNILRLALERSKKLGIPIIEHSEDENLSAGGAINENHTSKKLNLRGIPQESESIMVARNIFLSKLTNAPLHCAHISSKDSVKLLAMAKKKKIPVTSETCPHYFTLTDKEVEKSGALAKMKPPLRTEEDVETIKEGLSNGTIQIIATDHAPHAAHLKRKPLSEAPFGIIGLETLFALVYNELILKSVLSPMEAIALMTAAPAKIFNLPGGNFSEGSPADIALFNPQEEWTARSKTFASKSKNSPFIGRKFKGKIVATLVDGRIVLCCTNL